MNNNNYFNNDNKCKFASKKQSWKFHCWVINEYHCKATRDLHEQSTSRVVDKPIGFLIKTIILLFDCTKLQREQCQNRIYSSEFVTKP